MTQSGAGVRNAEDPSALNSITLGKPPHPDPLTLSSTLWKRGSRMVFT